MWIACRSCSTSRLLGMKPPRLLIVDDEQAFGEMLGDSFRLTGYEVETALDGLSALSLVRKTKFDLIISDINMPVMDGLEFLTKLRGLPDDTPAIMLSARNERPDITTALRLGADDYVAKPFGLEELALRVAAVLKRTMKIVEPQTLVCGPVELIEEFHEVRLNGEVVELAPTEFKLLRELLLKQGKVVSKSTLLNRVWDIHFDADASVINTYISYLRRKLHTPTWQGIRTIRGVGFQISAKAE
jgi:two-component system OmpR family response regulator